MRQYFVLFSALSLFLSACGSVDLNVITPPPVTPTDSTAGALLQPGDVTAMADGPVEMGAIIPPTRDPLGELYFFTLTLTPTGIPNLPYQLMRLPGSCVLGLAECPQAEAVVPPFRWHTAVRALSWSPDGDGAVLAYPDDPMLQSRIWLFDPAAGTWTSIFESAYVDSPVWSPDGNWIVFLATDVQEVRALHAIQRDGSGLKTLVLMSNLPDTGYPYVLDGWIGGNIILRPDWVEPGQQARIFSVSLADGQVQPVPETLAAKAKFRFSNDGGWLAYDEYNPESMEHAFFVAQADAGNPVALGRFVTDTSWFPFVWSPDNNRLAFVQDDTGPGKGTTMHVNVINRDGTGLQEACRPVDIGGGMLFSPDGKFLLASEMGGSGPIFGRIFVVNLETLEQRILDVPSVSPELGWFYPSWRR